jgi:N-acetylmuramoyl-L-alanine amidase
MTRSSRIGFVAASLLLCAVAAHAAPTVSGVRHAVRDDNTRVVIDLSKPAKYEIKRFDNPERIAVNIPGVRLSNAVRPLSIEGSIVERVRFNRLSWGSQVVLDLKAHARWLDFHLIPVDDMPFRIVLDVQGGNRTTEPPPVWNTTPRIREPRPFVVAIDAGHGGSDPGASRGRLIEKTAALDIARRLEKAIERHKGYRAFLTRQRDVFISLPERTEIARENGADIFVSVHLNSAPKRHARGSEVFFLSPSGAEATADRFLRNRNRAAEELGLEGRGSDDILHMLVDVNQQSMMERSSALAEEILKSLNRQGVPPPRMVKQRSFAVLKSVTMPSVMVETGFVTNPSDAKVLSSDSGRSRIAEAIADGVVSFLKKYPLPKDETGKIVVHRVQKGDTLWRISRRYNTSVASIQKSNKLGSSKMIRVGQELVIRERNETY